jgi:hypothetical protein
MPTRDSDPLRRDLDAVVARFAAKGLVAAISTNGGLKDADIDVTKVTRGALTKVALTEKGLARLG